MLTEDKSKQLAEDEYWMQQALSLAKKAELAGEVPVGAVVVKQKAEQKLEQASKQNLSQYPSDKNTYLLGEGFNQSISHHDPTAHAEISALRNAAVKISNYRITDGTTLYVTLEPCIMCAGAIVHARINRVVFAAYDPKTGAAGSVFSLLENEKNNHRIEVSGGILEDEASALIRNFFRARRKLKAAEKALKKNPNNALVKNRVCK